MKRIIIVLCVILCLSSCSGKRTEKYISECTGISLSSGKITFNEDSHGGFLGDGLLTVKVQFGKSMSEETENSGKWQPLPMSEECEYLIYGLNEDITDFVPGIKNGYYMLEDSSPEKDTPPEDRAAYNFITAIYDADTDIMYFIKFDT